MDRTTECIKCDKEFQRPEDVEWGGEFTCPHCGAEYNSSFDTQCGLIVELS